MSPGSARIALLSTSFPAHLGDPSGHFVETEALQWALRGFEVHVVVPGPVARREVRLRMPTGQEATLLRWQVGGGQLFGFPGAVPRMRERPLRLVALPSFLENAARALQSIGACERLIAHFLLPCGFPLALGAPRSIEMETVGHGSDVRLLASLPSPLRHHLVARMLDRGLAFRFAAVKAQETLMCALRGPLADRLGRASRVVPPPLDLPRQVEDRGAQRAALGLPSSEVLWVSCARLVKTKRVDLAIDEAARVGVHLLVVGDGPERPALERHASRRGAAVTFLGQLPRPRALAYIAIADKLVHFSEQEGSPSVVREARALGVAVWCAPSGDAPAWALEDEGIVIRRTAEVPSPAHGDGFELRARGARLP